MADQKLSELTFATGAASSDLLYVVQGNTSKKIYASSLASSIINIAATTSITLNILKIDDGVHEKFQTLADATGTVTHNCSSGHIFYHTSPDANWTANFTNVPTTDNRAIAMVIIINQGGTGRYPSAVQIAGVGQTIRWANNVTPTPGTNRFDIATFTLLRVSSTWFVVGNYTNYA